MGHIWVGLNVILLNTAVIVELILPNFKYIAWTFLFDFIAHFVFSQWREEA